jgi:hypothetical protein
MAATSDLIVVSGEASPPSSPPMNIVLTRTQPQPYSHPYVSDVLLARTSRFTRTTLEP